MNEENILEPKAIEELLELSFYVESYQRGYRWGKTEVEALLDDIMEFAKKEKINGESYWLQPIIVKEVKEKLADKSISSYELIDGQQRLSTIYIILNVLGNDSTFQIHYNTRTSSAEFLHTIEGLNKYQSWEDYIEVNRDNDKIDNFYFFNSFKIIQDYFNRDENNTDKIKELFVKTLLQQTNIIWYELVSDDSMLPKIIFEQINDGKISLTNAELVKALYLNTTVEALKRDEIAQKWDRIEYALNDKRFWAFISNDIDKEHNRIEYLLDLISGKYNNDKNKEEKLHTFLYFSKKVNKFDAWEKVESYFQTLLGWFESPEIFHYVGYLIARKHSSIKELMDMYNSKDEEKKTKSEFANTLISKIKEKISKHEIETLDFDKANDKKKIHDILLLFNVQTVLDTTPYSFFPFEKYKRENWSLEHIYAQQSEQLSNPEAIKEWILETQPVVKSFLEDPTKKDAANELHDALEEALQKNEDVKLGDLPTKVYNFFGGKDEDMDLLSNMALLDKDTNSSLSNSVFPVKRRKILNAEANKENKKFIPICTKNVFLKFYSEDTRHFQFWGEDDKKDYLKQMINCLEPFNLGGQ